MSPDHATAITPVQLAPEPGSPGTAPAFISLLSADPADEELRRMSSVVDQLSAHSLVLFNESFAATNEREGSEICRQVVRALLEAGTRVFFVTHHLDFADSLRHGDPGTALFLRAPRERTFKLVPADPLPTSFGQDDYHRIGGWLAEGSAAG